MITITAAFVEPFGYPAGPFPAGWHLPDPRDPPDADVDALVGTDWPDLATFQAAWPRVAVEYRDDARWSEGFAPAAQEHHLRAAWRSTHAPKGGA